MYPAGSLSGPWRNWLTVPVVSPSLPKGSANSSLFGDCFCHTTKLFVLFSPGKETKMYKSFGNDIGAHDSNIEENDNEPVG